MTLDLISIGLWQGLILAIIAYGLMIPFRFLNFPDLTVEGAYPLGGAICASLIILKISPLIAMLASMLGAGMMAIATSQIYLRLKVNSLLAGMILSVMAYSVNLRMMGKPNIALFGYETFNIDTLNVFIILTISVTLFALFLLTDFGLRFRAVGLNTHLAKKQGISINKHTMLGLFLAGSLFGLAGSLIVQMQHFMDIGMGIGIVIHGLASLMLGETLLGNNNLLKQLLAPIIGALIYQQIQGFALSLGLAISDLKFFTGSIILLVIMIQRQLSNEHKH